MIRFLPLILMFVLTVYTVASCVGTSSEDMPAGLPKPVWIIILILSTPLGPIAWLVLRFIARFNNSSLGKKTKKEKFVAPDDNDEFLFKLDRDMQLRRDGKRREDIENTAPKFYSKNFEGESDVNSSSDDDLPDEYLDDDFGKDK